MVIAGTITVKMAPRVKRLWEQMPEPKWAIAMGSCAISGDFYRDLYAVVPGIDTVLPVDVYIPGCPPNPEALMQGLMRLQEKVKLTRAGKLPPREVNPSMLDVTRPSVMRKTDPARDPSVDLQQEEAALQVSAFDRSDERPEGAPEDEVYAPVTQGEGGEDLVALLRDEFGVTDFPKDGAPLVDPSRHVALARRLRGIGFAQFVYVAASHYPAKTGAKPAPERFEVAYAVRTIGKGSRLASWRLALAPDEAAPTLVGVYAGADWQEREQFDLLGVRFEGHPDLRRIMMPDNYEGHPLRKDFPSDKACAPWR
jgi:NADH-quinone oxidoreductase subunit B/C/D